VPKLCVHSNTYVSQVVSNRAIKQSLGWGFELKSNLAQGSIILVLIPTLVPDHPGCSVLAGTYITSSRMNKRLVGDFKDIACVYIPTMIGQCKDVRKGAHKTTYARSSSYTYIGHELSSWNIIISMLCQVYLLAWNTLDNIYY
jgi:hypothetical protein